MATAQEIIQMLQQYDIIGAVIIVLAAYIVGLIVKFSIRKIAKRLAKKTKTSLDDELLHAFEKPILWLIILMGVFVALLTLRVLSGHSAKILMSARLVGIIWGCWLVIRIIGGLFKWYAAEISVKTKSEMDDKYMHIFRRVVNMVIYAIVLMLILQQLGVEITPLVASLGIGGLAIALALQDTLANFFSGFYMISDRAVKIGDYVEIEAPGGSIKGHVEDIGWRTSKLKTLTQNHVIIPNSTFANATVVNYQAPKPHMSLIVNVGVAYDSDLEKVETVTNEVIEDVHNTVDGGIRGEKGIIRYREFADSSITFIAIVKINDPVKQGPVRHEFIKRLKKRYDQEGIEIPFPIRTVYMHEQQSA